MIVTAASWSKTFVLAGLALVVMAGASLAQTKDVKRCGWYANPTPANHWLTDRDGTWVLMTQGGPSAEGWLDLPAQAFDFTGEWVEVNGSYGYGCACVTGRFGSAFEVLRVTSMTPLPLARCEADKTLEAP